MAILRSYHFLFETLLSNLLPYFKIWSEKQHQTLCYRPIYRRCACFSSAGSSKIKIRTSSWHKFRLALCHDEVRILIFDDTAEQKRSESPQFCFTQLYSTRVGRDPGIQSFQSFRTPVPQQPITD